MSQREGETMRDDAERETREDADCSLLFVYQMQKSGSINCDLCMGPVFYHNDYYYCFKVGYVLDRAMHHFYFLSISH
jgi:hypothetical protein